MYTAVNYSIQNNNNKDHVVNQRWQSKSKQSTIDNVIHGIAVGALITLGLVGLSAIIGIGAFIVLANPSALLIATYIVANIILCGTGSISIPLMHHFDWNNYSRMETVYNEFTYLTTKTLPELLNYSYRFPSPIYRLGQLEKYGVISEKTRLEIQLFVCNYNNDRDIIKFFNDNSHINFSAEKMEEYNNAKERLKAADLHWPHFQREIAKDMPKIVKLS